MVQRAAPSARAHRPAMPSAAQITPKVEIKACPKNLQRFSLAKWQQDATMVRREKLGRKDTYMYQTRKIGVVGQGHVGALCRQQPAYAGIADELYLCDINEAKGDVRGPDLRDSFRLSRTTPRSSTATTTTRSWPAATSSSTPPARSRWPPATATVSCSLPPTPPAPLPSASSTPASMASS